jgi:hypothetical protein
LSGSMGGPAYSMRPRTAPKDAAHNVPGPGAYDLGSTVGKTTAKTMSPRYARGVKESTPGPGAYGSGGGLGFDAPKYSMTSRHQPNDLSAETPGPVCVRWLVVFCPRGVALGALGFVCLSPDSSLQGAYTPSGGIGTGRAASMKARPKTSSRDAGPGPVTPQRARPHPAHGDARARLFRVSRLTSVVSRSHPSIHPLRAGCLRGAVNLGQRTQVLDAWASR